MKKTLLFVSLITFLVMSLFAQEIAIPEWVDKEIKQTYSRFHEWKGKDDVVIFPIQTDVHSGGRDTYKQVAYVNHAAKTFNFDFIADLGDIGLDTPATKEVKDAKEFLERHATIHQQYPGISVVLVGNHDHNRIAKEGKFTDKELGEIFNVPSLKKANGRLVLAENPTYGYIDIPERKTRVFFMNTCDRDDSAHYYTMATKQLQFLADNLQVKEDGWNAFILTHFCVLPLGHWNDDQSECFNREIYLQILKDCNAKAKGELNGVKWDFSKGTPCHVVANLTGDSHFDAEENHDGIYFAISQGYGGVAEASMPKWSSKTPFNPSQQMLVDIAAYKPATHELKLFRMGAGGKEKDRQFKW